MKKVSECFKRTQGCDEELAREAKKQQPMRRTIHDLKFLMCNPFI